MTAGPLTPELALAYLRELSLDVRAAVVLDAAGAPLAGDAALAARAAEALPDGESAGSWSVAGADGALVLARSRGGLAIAVTAGARTLLPLLEHDLKRVLNDLADA
jgi:hypothetical protein